MRHRLAVACVALALSAGLAAAAGVFSHARGFDAFGYYLPRHPVQAGPYRFDDLSIGPADQFDAWERGRRSQTYAPVMLEFSDLRSPVKANELGEEVHAVRIRVLPDSYRVAPGDLAFRGHDARLGDVAFEGALDARARARSQQANGNGVVAVGTLRFAGRRFRRVALTWFGGD